MSRRYLLAFVISVLILLLYPHYLKWVGIAPPEKKRAEPERVEPRVFGWQETPSVTQGKSIAFKNPFYDISFSTLGGTVEVLQEEGTTLFRSGGGEKGIFGIRILHESEDLTQKIFREPSESGDGTSQFFEYENPGQYRIVKRFFIGSDRPSLALELVAENLSEKERHFPFEVAYGIVLDAGDHHDESKVKVVRALGDEVRSVALGTVRKKPLIEAQPLDWHGLTKKYHAILVKPESKIVGEETLLEGEKLWSRLRLAPLTVPPGGKGTVRFAIYAGPQRYELLKEFGFGFEKIFSSGALGFPRLAVLISLKFFYGLSHNYGVAILLLTLVIKLLFTPLTHLSYQSMQKMQALQPKIKALQKQFQKDPGRLNKELMELYRRNRVNPMMGCLPLVLQIPIFIAFYQVLSEAVELKGAGFIGWMHDLSAPDHLFTFPTTLPFIGDAFNLLPLVMIGSMLWQQKLTPQTTADPMQAKLLYVMPIVFGLVFYNLPSGLVLYWTANNFLTIFHQLVIKRVPIILHHEDAGK